MTPSCGGRASKARLLPATSRLRLITAAPLRPTPPPPAGCDSVGLTVQPGMPGTPGAAFLLNITWNSKAGLLLPSGENAVPALFLGK